MSNYKTVIVNNNTQGTMAEKNSLRKYFLCGGVGGVFNVGFGYPMDTIKVRLQTMPPPKPGEQPLYTGTIDCIRKTIQMDGYKGLFRGILAPIVVAGPVYAINFCGFALGKKLLEETDDHIHTLPELFAAGAFAGALASIFTAPSEHIKCLLQIHDDSGPNPKYKGTFDCFKKLYTEGGFRYVYKGTLATILRDIPAAGIYFMSYEELRRMMKTEEASPTNRIMTTLIAGGLAGMLYWLVGMPADVLKTRIQSAPNGKRGHRLREVYMHLITTEGPSGLYAGLIPVMLRAFPSNAACFLGFEVSLKLVEFIIPDF